MRWTSNCSPASQTLTVAVSIVDRETALLRTTSPATPPVLPAQLVVTGPSEVVDQVARAEATVQLRGARSTVREEEPHCPQRRRWQRADRPHH